MSTDSREREFIDERERDGWHDPHDIVPESFRKRHPDASTVAEALRQAERAATNSDPDEFPRCPECLSVRIRRKDGHLSMDHKIDAAYKCSNCGAHFDEPAPSREETRPGEQATLPGVRER